MPALDGLDVLVTRPEAQGREWATTLKALGAQPLTVPLMELRPLDSPAEKQAIKACILDFDLYQKAIFVSRNAVAYAMEWLEDYWPQLPMGIEYFGVGERTARALLEHQIPVTALQRQGAMNSEALLETPALQADAVRHQRIVIFRGQGGRGVMAEVLRARGARVDYCELYQRRCPPAAAEALANALPGDATRPLVVALHSGETLDNYVQTLARLTPNSPAAKRLQQALLLVPGERVTKQAQNLGFDSDRVLSAENATDSGMLAALHRAAERPDFFQTDGTNHRD